MQLMSCTTVSTRTRTAIWIAILPHTDSLFFRSTLFAIPIACVVQAMFSSYVPSYSTCSFYLPLSLFLLTPTQPAAMSLAVPTYICSRDVEPGLEAQAPGLGARVRGNNAPSVRSWVSARG